MEISSFQSYLIILFVVLIIISIFVFRQFLRTRSEELNLVKFEQVGLDSLTRASELYEFGSIQIKKRLYSEATKTFLKAIENSENEPDEAKAIINNALGFSYAAQNEFKKAIKHYNSAIKSLPEYPIALNNLASAQQRLLEYDLAYATYQKVLTLDPKNKTAIKNSKELEKRKNYKPYKGIKNKGF
jgi:tetratricopeptide (TPR) repeat protein